MQILFPFPVKDPPLYYVPDTRHKLRITKTGELTPPPIFFVPFSCILARVFFLGTSAGYYPA